VTVLGHDIFKNIIAVYAALGAVPQETALCEELSAWTKMSLHADLYGVRGPKSDGRIAENAKSSPTLRTSREWSEYILGRYEVLSYYSLMTDIRSRCAEHPRHLGLYSRSQK